jgi:geranylgeranyl diphosphate synthase, type I
VLNYAMVTTVHGQFNDIFNEVSDTTSEQDVFNVMEWKTAHYTFLNPLTFGMVLAGADCGPTDAIAPYALNAGMAFQITDDILGTFGTEFESGKSPLDDMREGKRTLLIVHALKHASAADKTFLLRQVGNPKLTQADFKRCKEIIVSSGALEFAQNHAKKYIDQALRSLENTNQLWSEEGRRFLAGLAESLLSRKA